MRTTDHLSFGGNDPAINVATTVPTAAPRARSTPLCRTSPRPRATLQTMNAVSTAAGQWAGAITPMSVGTALRQQHAERHVAVRAHRGHARRKSHRNRKQRRRVDTPVTLRCNERSQSADSGGREDWGLSPTSEPAAPRGAPRSPIEPNQRALALRQNSSKGRRIRALSPYSSPMQGDVVKL